MQGALHVKEIHRGQCLGTLAVTKTNAAQLRQKAGQDVAKCSAKRGKLKMRQNAVQDEAKHKAAQPHKHACPKTKLTWSPITSSSSGAHAQAGSSSTSSPITGSPGEPCA
eukprot:1146016-Pelagomonas_calceolata.AAC.8